MIVVQHVQRHPLVQRLCTRLLMPCRASWPVFEQEQYRTSVRAILRLLIQVHLISFTVTTDTVVCWHVTAAGNTFHAER